MSFWRFLDGSDAFGTPLSASYDPFLVLLSFLVAMLASHAALEVTERRSRLPYGTAARRVWFVTGAIAMGSGVWAMHFIGMLAFSIPVSMTLDVQITALSVIPAIFASGCALYIMNRSVIERWRLHLGGLLMGAGIGTMHYTGMEAMNMDAIMGYDPVLFGLSIVVAHVLATCALYIKFRLAPRQPGSAQWSQMASVGLMGMAVAGMHYTAMGAAEFFPLDGAAGTGTAHEMGHNALYLAGAISLVTSLILGVVIVSTNVGRRMAAISASLVLSEERSQLLLLSAGEGICGIDTRGQVSFINPVGARLLGAPVERVIGESWHALVHPPDAGDSQCQGARCQMGEALVADAGLPATEGWVRTKAGARVPVEYTSKPVYRAGELDGAVLVFSDISHRKRVERELRVAKERAEHATLAKSDFLAQMSHELRTPMTGILGTAQLLADTRMDDQQRDYLGIIQSSGSALLTIINDILDLSKIEAGKLDIEAVPMDLRAIAGEVLALLASAADRQSLSLSLNYPDSLPQYFVGDPGRLRQVLLNLAGNAVKFTRAGSVDIDVEVARAVDEPLDENRSVDGEALEMFDATVAVRDTGIGISPDAVARLFSAYQQANAATSRQYGGTGLGLAVCKQLVELMGGEIGVASRQGHGSRFWFRVPLASTTRASVASSAEASSARVDSSEPMSVGQLRILIAEDNPINQRVVAQMLRAVGHLVDIVDNGGDAVERHGDYDVLFMDCQMPVLDGYAATEAIRLRERDRHLPIIAMTAHAMEGDRQRCLDAGMDDYLSKPVLRPELEAALARAFAPRRSEDSG